MNDRKNRQTSAVGIRLLFGAMLYFFCGRSVRYVASD